MTYDEFINNILNTRGRFNCGNEYHERHHIVPKCLNGTDTEDNLIDLFAREHFIAHKLLAEKYPDSYSIIQAYHLMTYLKNNVEQRYVPTPEEYEEARKKFSQMLKQKYRNKENHPCYGTHISEKRKKAISNANKGNKYCLGRVVSEKTRKKIGDANRNPTTETRKKMSEARKGKNLRGTNPNAKPVIRLSDKKIYACMKDAAEDNNIKYSTFKTRMLRGNSDFMLYSNYLKLEK